MASENEFCKNPTSKDTITIINSESYDSIGGHKHSLDQHTTCQSFSNMGKTGVRVECIIILPIRLQRSDVPADSLLYRADVRRLERCLGTRFKAGVFFRGMLIRPRSI